MKAGEGKFKCAPCGYSTRHRGHWKEHVRTVRHRRAMGEVVDHECPDCGKVYKHRQSLHKHRRECTSRSKAQEAPRGAASQKDTSSAELLKVIEQLIPRVNQTTNHINVQILLNEECGDAMTIQSFATNLRMSLRDICRQKESGKPAIMSKIVSENLGPLRIQDRPIHCTDDGRSKWLVHDEREGWKEDSGNTVIRAASFGITRRFQELWDAAHPDWRNDDSLRTSWIDIVACLNTDPSDGEVAATLDRLAPHCRLSAEELRTSLLLASGD